MQQISPIYLQHQLLENPQTYFLLDVREPFEYQIANIDNSLLMPMNQVSDRLQELEKSRAIVVVCHHGMRSENVAYYLDQQGFTQIFNLTGGIDAWARSCDSGMALY
ncbi:rhodanese [Methylococcaceae bacterium HT4]|nr:rhodanese [Methylococcaceae bacterium CS4]TXL00301.1 rhodanese [Methylococcaceae bacterium CS5]TXL05904.1 rhodanese [Methylococcaceae bacterium CS1]TXL07112.1 rhodanese [Methylococcaceae bacterium CS3]TXL11740.1 rhodanese [Methylococcaceae bacterium CS2]TXL15341.1 rhodanese [Methylococcaceae bacterium HT4]